MVFYEVPGGREVFAGKVSTHSWKYLLYVFLWDFGSGGRQIYKNKHKKGKTKKNSAVLKTAQDVKSRKITRIQM